MRLALALPAVVAALLLLPAAAPAQAPPDERAAAQAYADAAKRFQAAIEPLAEEDTAWIDACEKAFDRIPGAYEEDAIMIAFSHGLRLALAQFSEPLRSFRSALANVVTADPALISGRAAVRQLGRRIDALPAPGRFCAELRAWKRAGYPRATVRKAEAELNEAAGAFSRGIVRKLVATAMRMRELGVSKQGAEAFAGESGW